MAHEHPTPASAIEIPTDCSIVKIIHQETIDGFHIEGFLNRFGGLTVFVFDTDNDWQRIFQGDNILRARQHIRDRQ